MRYQLHEINELRHSNAETVGDLQTKLNVVNDELENWRHERELPVKQEDNSTFGVPRLDQRVRTQQHDSRYPIHSPQYSTGTRVARVDDYTDPDPFRLDDHTKLETEQLELRR